MVINHLSSNAVNKTKHSHFGRTNSIIRRFKPKVSSSNNRPHKIKILTCRLTESFSQRTTVMSFSGLSFLIKNEHASIYGFDYIQSRVTNRASSNQREGYRSSSSVVRYVQCSFKQRLNDLQSIQVSSL